jgi:hypothetical protein
MQVFFFLTEGKLGSYATPAPGSSSAEVLRVMGRARGELHPGLMLCEASGLLLSYAPPFVTMRVLSAKEEPIITSSPY